MAIFIERTITINNDRATLDKPIYFYIGDGNITCIFTINEKEKTARFGSINNSSNIIQDNEDIDYGEAYIYKPNRDSATTTRTQIVGDKLQVEFKFDNIDEFSEAGVHKLQIHLYDSESGGRNRLTIPPVDINVLMPVGYDTNAADEAIVDYSLLDRAGDPVSTFDDEGNYNKTEWGKGDIITSNRLNKIEDALYEINAADNDFITNEGLETALADKADAGHKHTANNISGLARVATTGSYNDLSGKPAIPNTNNLATKAELEGKADYNHNHEDIYAPISHTHAGYSPIGHTHNDEYLTEVPATYATKTYVRDYINDSGFITSIPSAYVTESELENELDARGYASEDYVIRKISEAELGGGESGDPSELLKNYATIAQVNTKADKNHTHSSYLTQSSLDNYATKTYVDNAIEEIENGGITVTPPDMSNYPTIDVMNEALAGKANNGHTHDGYSTIGHTHEDYALKSDIPNMVEVPNNVSAFINDAGYITEEDISDYVKKDDMPTVPTNVSEFANDANYITSGDITKIMIVAELPETEEPGVLYIVKE